MKPEFVAQGTSRRDFFVKAYGSVWSRPVLLIVFGVFGCLLLWLVLTKSLPLVLAKTNSELGWRLAPEHPAVLLARAESQRRRLVELISTELAKEQKLRKATSETTAAGRYAAPSIAQDGETSAVDREALRTEIRDLATQILKQAPLSARAHRLLAEVSEEEETVRKYMLAAFQSFPTRDDGGILAPQRQLSEERYPGRPQLRRRYFTNQGPACAPYYELSWPTCDGSGEPRLACRNARHQPYVARHFFLAICRSRCRIPKRPCSSCWI